MNNDLILEALECLEMLNEDCDASKKIKQKTSVIITLLKNNQEFAVDKALMELEDLNSNNISSYHRTQIWDIVSLLESSRN